jgi:hypothetical protein
MLDPHARGNPFGTGSFGDDALIQDRPGDGTIVADIGL